MGLESLSEIARQINPQLWDKPESSDPNVRIVHPVYEDPSIGIIALDSVTIKRPGRPAYTYANKHLGTPYEAGAVLGLRTVFLNYSRNTMTIAFEDVDETTRFATWTILIPEDEKSKIRFKPVHQNNYR